MTDTMPLDSYFLFDTGLVLNYLREMPDMPFDSCILTDTEHLHDHVNTHPDIVLGHIDESVDTDSLDGKITDHLDTRVDTLIYKAMQDNAQRETIASEPNESDFWRETYDFWNKGLERFVRNSVEDAEHYIPNKTLCCCTLVCLAKSLAQGDEISISTAIARAKALIKDLTITDHVPSVHSIVPDTDGERTLVCH